MNRKRNWKRQLTDKEAATLSRLESKIAKHEEVLIVLRAQRQRIQNRATARAGK